MRFKHLDSFRLYLRVDMPQSFDNHSQGGEIRCLLRRRNSPLQEFQSCDRIALSIPARNDDRFASVQTLFPLSDMLPAELIPP